MKQLQSTWVLLVLVLGIGGYIYFNERGPAGQEDAIEVLRVQADQVETISLQGGGKTLQLRRDGAEWYVAPVTNGKAGESMLASKESVDSLLQNLQLVESKSVVESPSNLKEFGLEKPASSITVDGKKLEFGTPSAVDPQSVYVKAGGTVALVPSTLSENSTKSLSDWRDKSLLRVKPEEVQAFSLKAPQVTAEFQKQDGKWQITAPITAAADTAGVDAAIMNLSTTQSTAWLDEKGKDLKKWGLDKPQLTLTIADNTLKIGKKLSGGYAGQNSLSPAVFQVPETVFTQWNKPLKDWRDKQIASFTVGDVTAVEVTARKATKSFQKVEEQWQQVDGKKDDKVNSSVQDLLFAASSWTAQDFVDKPATDSAYGFDAPLAKLKITGKEVTELTVGQKNNKVFVRTGSGTVAELGSEAATALKAPLDNLFPVKK